MKKISLLGVSIAFCFFIIQCTPGKKVLYVVPATITGESRVAMAERLDEGQRLFKIHCSGCHGIFSNGKDSIPNFSKTEIEAYKAAIILDDPKNHAVAQQIRPQDLEKIFEFLLYRKKPAQ
jgi:mono/diheme cytochrome c family protein